jgi:hypothetical protein
MIAMRSGSLALGCNGKENRSKSCRPRIESFTGVSSTRGPEAGSTVVTITGTGFDRANEVDMRAVTLTVSLFPAQCLGVHNPDRLSESGMSSNGLTGGTSTRRPRQGVTPGKNSIRSFTGELLAVLAADPASAARIRSAAGRVRNDASPVGAVHTRATSGQVTRRIPMIRLRGQPHHPVS